MDELKLFIAEWDKAGDIAVILEKGLKLPPADKVQSYLASLPETESDRIRQSLTSAMIALEEHSANLARELAETQEQIDRNVKNKKASLSYLSADTIRRK